MRRGRAAIDARGVSGYGGAYEFRDVERAAAGAGDTERVPAGAPTPVRVGSRAGAIGAALAAALFCLYLANARWVGDWDSLPARYLPFSIWREGDLDLDEFPWLRALGPMYFLRRSPSGHWVSAFPVATPVLVSPLYLPALWWMRQNGVGDDDVRFRVLALVMERVAAAALAAAAVGVLLLALVQIIELRLAVPIALASGVATSTWHISSQALWQHGLAELALAGTSWALMRPDSRRNAVLAGGFAALGVLARPSMAVFAFVALLFVLGTRRHRLAAFSLLPVLGAALLLAYNLHAVGQIAGGYGHEQLYRQEMGWPRLERFLGLLVSPNRGLFAYTPIAALGLGALWLPSRHRAWLRCLLAGFALYVLLYSCFRYWWAAHVYGPRYLVDAIPALALASVPAVERLRREALAAWLALALLVWSAGVQAIGVYCSDREWDRTPVDVNEDPRRVWDSKDLQVVRSVRNGCHPAELLPALHTLADARAAARLRVLGRDELVGEIRAGEQGPLHLQPGERRELRVRVANRSGAPWPWFADWGYLDVVLAYRWRGPGQEKRWGTVPLGRNLLPGEEVVLRVPIEAPHEPGNYALSLYVAQRLDDHRMGSGGTEQHLLVTVNAPSARGG